MSAAVVPISREPVDPLVPANALLAVGVPVVVGVPNPTWTPGAKVSDVLLPSGWSTVTADECDLSDYRPGVDTLAMVGGHGVDAVDEDPEADGSVGNIPSFRYFGVHRTPSGGRHYLVRSTGIGKVSPLTTEAGHVGDYIGGTVGGGGRALLYLPGSTRPSYPRRGYSVEMPLDLDALLEHGPDDELVSTLLLCGGSRDGSPGRPAARRAEVAAFYTKHAVLSEPECNYGRRAVAELVAEADATVPGDVTKGRHGWAVRAVTRTVELIRSGCASAADLDRLEATLDRIKPEGGSDFGGIVAWALTNADGSSRCGLHNPQPASVATGAEAAAEAEAFWQERESLSYIRDLARARMVSPWALLGAVLARLVTTIPPQVKLPAVIGTEASLNLFVTLVGPSGSGKGAASTLSAKAFPGTELGTVPQAGAGSGEGIGHLFAHREGRQKELVRHETRVLLTVEEIGTLGAVGSRQGATLLPELRKAWSGEPLGFAYATPEKRLPIDAHSYRLCLVTGLQPALGGVLLDDAHGGTPQRFLWLPTTDPGMRPDAPEPDPQRVAHLAERWREPWRNVDTLPIPPVAWETIRAAHLARGRGEGDALDGHSLLTRLVAAAALCLLDGRRCVTDDDWRLAGHLLAVSDRTRGGVQRVIESESEKATAARGKAEGARAVVAAATIAAAAERTTVAAVKAHLRAASGSATRGKLNKALNSRLRDHLDAALVVLERAGDVTVEGNGNRLRVTLAGGAQ